MMKYIQTVIGAVLFAVLMSAGVMAAEVGEDGLHKQPWFVTTFKDVAEDIEQAKSENKRLIILIEQRGCIYCEKMHKEVLSNKMVKDFITENFMVVQYNMFGDEEVTDLDGDTLTEKKASSKWGMNFTPVMMFLPEDPGDGSKSAKDAAVSVMPGAFGKWTTLNMMKWVKEKGYERDEPFQKYHARLIQEARDKGLLGSE